MYFGRVFALASRALAAQFMLGKALNVRIVFVPPGPLARTLLIPG